MRATDRRYTVTGTGFKFVALLLLLAGALLLPPGARAAQCSVQSTGVNFGVYDPISAVTGSSSGSVTVTCTYIGQDVLSGFQVTLGLSTESSNTYATRTMKRAVEALNYNLYKYPPHTIVFGNGSGGTQDTTLCFPGFLNNCNGSGGTIGSTQAQTVTIYGLLPASQDISPGAYIDTIVTTLTF